MYYEEKWVDGVLWWRGTHTGDWVRMSYAALSHKCAELEADCNRQRAALDAINERAANWHVGFGRKDNRRWIFDTSLAALQSPLTVEAPNDGR